MIIRNFFKKIKISKYTYIILLLSLLTGLIKDIFSIFILIIFHEFGHYFVSYLFKYNIDSINIYPFGGIIKYNEEIDKPLFTELLITIMGPINQILIYLIISILFKYNLINNYLFSLFKNYHYSILIFNLLPIIPLDGSKLLNIFLNKVFNYIISYNLLSIISIISTILFILKSDSNYIIIISFIIYETLNYIKNRNIMFNRLILEKYLYNNNYKKYRYINNLNDIKRNKKHLIKYKNIYLSEKTYINNIYKEGSK